MSFAGMVLLLPPNITSGHSKKCTMPLGCCPWRRRAREKCTEEGPFVPCSRRQSNSPVSKSSAFADRFRVQPAWLLLAWVATDVDARCFERSCFESR